MSARTQIVLVAIVKYLGRFSGKTFSSTTRYPMEIFHPSIVDPEFICVTNNNARLCRKWVKIPTDLYQYSLVHQLLSKEVANARCPNGLITSPDRVAKADHDFIQKLLDTCPEDSKLIAAQVTPLAFGTLRDTLWQWGSAPAALILPLGQAKVLSSMLVTEQEFDLKLGLRYDPIGTIFGIPAYVRGVLGQDDDCLACLPENSPIIAVASKEILGAGDNPHGIAALYLL
jgi:hypothetical protein